ncbi:GumC family protein [Sinorhizobium glycinis]|nr:GNVR domain-containing protein [Sinorhizobium glycinis]
MLATDHFVVPSPGSPHEPAFPPPKDRDTLSVEDIIRFSRRSWRICLFWMAVSLGLGGVFAILSPGLYTAYATILLSSPPPLQADEVEIADARAHVDNQIQVIQSDEVVGRAVDRTGLLEDEEFMRTDEGLRERVTGYVRSRLASLFGTELPTVEPNLRHEATIRLRYGLSVRQLGFSNAVEIGFTSQDPYFSAELANAIAGSYIENQRELRLSARAEAALDLQQRLTELRDKAFATEALKKLPSDPQTAENTRARFREQQSTAEVYRSLYNALLQRAHSDSSASSLIPTARVITAAEPPHRRSWPPMILVVAVSIIAGGVAGFGHALIREATDRSLETAEDVRRSTGLDRIAEIPRISRSEWIVLEPSEQCLQPIYSNDSPALHSTMSKVAARMPGVQGHQRGFVIGVASPVARSGSSTVAVHLARVVAETGQKTLLVDANWQKPLAGKPMLNADPGRKLARAFATIPTDHNGLECLVLRPTAPTSELNASLSITAALQRLQQEYDCVVVDFQSTDLTADLEAAMDVISAVVVVLKARRTSSDHLEAILHIIPAEKVAAIIVNRMGA